MNIKKDIKILLKKIGEMTEEMTEEMTGEMREEIVIREDLVQTIE